MSQNLSALYRRWRRDYGFRTLGSAALSLAATALFALYNGYVGLAARSVWNGTICVYYLLLTGLRGYLLLAERRRRIMSPAQSRRAQRRAFAVSAAALVGLNLALVVPISLMVLLRRPVGIGLIPAICIAISVVLIVLFYKLTDEQAAMYAKANVEREEAAKAAKAAQ